MGGFFIFLFLCLLVLLLLGVLKPALISRRIKRNLSRKQIGIIFGVAALMALILGAITAPAKEQVSKTTGGAVRVQTLRRPKSSNTNAASYIAPTAPTTPTTAPALVSRTATAPAPEPEGQCDESLWNHIYHSYRLERINNCVTVAGTVDSVRREPDGDYHVDVALDAPYAGMVNQENIDQQHGDLVVEAICQNSVTQEDAVDACSGFSYPVSIPSIGAHVSVLGDYVLDKDHGWNELHPVYAFAPSGSQPQPAPVAQSSPKPAPDSSSPQTGAIKCNDGTYSQAAHRRGACSHHGGIAPGY